jgi:hypothetical protein
MKYNKNQGVMFADMAVIVDNYLGYSEERLEDMYIVANSNGTSWLAEGSSIKPIN